MIAEEFHETISDQFLTKTETTILKDCLKDFFKEGDLKYIITLLQSESPLTVRSLYLILNMKNKRSLYKPLDNLADQGIIKLVQNHEWEPKRYHTTMNLINNFLFQRITKIKSKCKKISKFANKFKIQFYESKTMQKTMKNSKIQENLQFLTQIQNKDGGWGIEEQSISSPLNTAEILLSFHKILSHAINPIQIGLDFLRKTQNENGSWFTKLYLDNEEFSVITTAKCIETLILYNSKEDQFRINKGIDWLISVNQNYLWSDLWNGPRSTIATVYVLDILMKMKKTGRHFDTIKKSIFQLISNQNADGGFPHYSNFDVLEGPSQISSTIHVYHILKIYIQNEQEDPIIQNALKDIIEYMSNQNPSNSIMSELQRRRINNYNFQFEHFNAAWIIYFYSFHKEIFNELYFFSLKYIQGLLQSNGCPVRENSRIYTWSTAHCIRALAATL